MKAMISTFIFLFSITGLAQTATIKDIPVHDSGSDDTQKETLISISKGSKISGKKFEVVEGHDEIEGEPQILKTEARKSWQTACSDWKKETKELNKENQILALSCNSVACVGAESNMTVCKSKGTYKLKVKME